MLFLSITKILSFGLNLTAKLNLGPQKAREKSRENSSTPTSHVPGTVFYLFNENAEIVLFSRDFSPKLK